MDNSFVANVSPVSGGLEAAAGGVAAGGAAAGKGAAGFHGIAGVASGVNGAGEVSGHVRMVGLNKRFGQLAALADFECEFQPGEMVVLLGPSGCGKTTALRVLTGLEQADSGTVLLDGRDITNLSPAKRNMAMVFQQYSLFPHLTAVQNVEFGLRVRGMKAAARRGLALQALELVGLSAHAQKFTSQMSGGQQQRVALARALVVKPALLALDEPLSALDAKVRVGLREQIRRIQQESGTTTLFVTHDQEEALAVADRVGVMHQGQIVQIASPREMYERPANKFVAEFIGTMNRLPALVSGGEAAVYGARMETLPGSTVQHFGGGAPVAGTALVRPEAVQLSVVAGGSSLGADAVPNEGVVTGVSFLGSQVRVEVRMGDLQVVTAQLPAGAAALQLGDLVAVSVRPQPVLVV